jgi:hypothetical protein
MSAMILDIILNLKFAIAIGYIDQLMKLQET